MGVKEVRNMDGGRKKVTESDAAKGRESARVIEKRREKGTG